MPNSSVLAILADLHLFLVLAHRVRYMLGSSELVEIYNEHLRQAPVAGKSDDKKNIISLPGGRGSVAIANNNI